MPRAAQAALAAGVAVFGFDADPSVPSNRALQVLTLRRSLPRGELEPRERFSEAALRVLVAAGVDLGGRRASRAERLRLVSVDDEPGRGGRTVAVWYYATAAAADLAGPGTWSVVGRGLRLDPSAAAALRLATEQLRDDARHVAGAAALVGDVFTGDDLLRVHLALHGGPEGSDRTFRRRIQEMRDAGLLRAVAEREVAALRARVPRFRSPAGTGGRPPELFRYAGGGGPHEELVTLRARRSG